MVKLLLKHNPDLNITDKFGKKIYEKAKTAEIAAIIQSASVANQFTRSKSVATLKAGTSPITEPKNGLYNAAKRDLIKMSQGPNHDQITELMRAYMEKMKEKISHALSKELEEALATQILKIGEELGRYLSEDFLAGGTKALENSLQLFNIRMEDTLRKHGIEPTQDLLLTDEEFDTAANPENVVYTEPNNNEMLVESMKLISKSPRREQRILSSGERSPEAELGINMMSYVGAMFEKMGQELLTTLSAKIRADMRIAIGTIRSSFATTNHESFEKFMREVENKISYLMKEKMTRISKSIKDKVQKTESMKRSRSQGKFDSSNIEGISMESTERLRSVLLNKDLQRHMEMETSSDRLKHPATERRSFSTTLSFHLPGKLVRTPFNLECAALHTAKVRPTTTTSSRQEKVAQINRKHAYLLRNGKNPPSEDYSAMDRVQKLNTEESTTFNKMLECLTQRAESVDKSGKLNIGNSAKDQAE